MDCVWPPTSFHLLSLPAPPSLAPSVHLSNFKALWRENMSVTGGAILGGQCFPLKQAQQIRTIVRTGPESE